MQKFTDLEKERLRVILDELRYIFDARSVGVTFNIDTPIYPMSKYDYRIVLYSSDKEF